MAGNNFLLKHCSIEKENQHMLASLRLCGRYVSVSSHSHSRHDPPWYVIVLVHVTIPMPMFYMWTFHHFFSMPGVCSTTTCTHFNCRFLCFVIIACLCSMITFANLSSPTILGNLLASLT